MRIERKQLKRINVLIKMKLIDNMKDAIYYEALD